MPSSKRSRSRCRRADKRGQPAQGLHRLGEVLKQEADEDVVEDAARGPAMSASAGVRGIADPGCPEPWAELGESDPAQPRLGEPSPAQATNTNPANAALQTRQALAAPGLEG